MPPAPFAELRAILGIILGAVLIAAAVIWIYRTLRRNGNGKRTYTQTEMEAHAKKIADERERKTLVAGEQTVDWWKLEMRKIADQSNEEMVENYLLPFFDARFDRLEMIIKGQDNILPFSRADWLEARKRKLDKK